MPFFSVIIPTYNSANVIAEAVDSILQQTFIDLEILIIDNSSSDATLSILSAFNSDRIKVVSGKDKGIYDAMNKGIGLATGEWIYFLGSDDRLYSPTVLESVYKSLANGRIDFFYGNVILNSNGSVYAGAFDILRLQEERNICHQSIFYHRDIFNRIGVFNLKYKIWADWEFNIRCFRHSGLQIMHDDIIISRYNDRQGASKNRDEVFYRELPLYYKDKYLSCLNKHEKYVRRFNNESIFLAARNLLSAIKKKIF
jgi:glycosyltransferase involved in cell wall biosynthesis